MAHIDDQHTQKANLDYIRQAMACPLLEKEHEHELALAWRKNKDEEALHELVNAYARLVVSLASKFKHYGLPLGDLIQEGNVGLMRAAERFDPDREVRFSTYANWWIRSYLQDYVLRNWSIVRTGSTAAHKSLFFNFRRLRAQIEGETEREGLSHEDHKKIAKELGVRVKDVEHMEARLSGVDSSLNSTIKNVYNASAQGNAAEWQDMLCDETPSPEETAISHEDGLKQAAWLKKGINKLNEREQYIIRMRHLNDEKATLETLGEDLGISKERVRQIENVALKKLRESICGSVSDPHELF